MVRVCHHINSLNTARKSNDNNHCNTPQYFSNNYTKNSEKKNRQANSQAWCLYEVYMKSDNQRKGIVKRTKWVEALEPKYTSPPQKYGASSADQSELKMR